VGTLAPGTPSAVYRADAINGLPALSFAQGYYTFPAAPTTTGSATVFLVSRGQPYLQTANLWLAGHYWGVANTTGYGTSVDAATSDSDWIVHAFRYTVRPVPAGTLPARVLQTWANGQLYATQRFDHAADVAWTSFSIGNNGASLFTGELSTAVFFNAALGDDQVDLVNRYLLHRHQIAV
jgi:hypothetical protein